MTTQIIVFSIIYVAIFVLIAYFGGETAKFALCSMLLMPIISCFQIEWMILSIILAIAVLFYTILRFKQRKTDPVSAVLELTIRKPNLVDIDITPVSSNVCEHQTELIKAGFQWNGDFWVYTVSIPVDVNVDEANQILFDAFSQIQLDIDLSFDLDVKVCPELWKCIVDVEQKLSTIYCNFGTMPEFCVDLDEIANNLARKSENGDER